MHWSIVIPAYNEAKRLPECLASVGSAIAEIPSHGHTFQIIVVDNNSTDGTGEIAHQFGATVVFEPVNQIARARNSGAAAASGDWLLFIDADSWLKGKSLREVLRVATEKCAGGGSLIEYDKVPFYSQVALACWNGYSRLSKMAAGSFLFCRAEAFREVGGFGTNLYAAEELELSMKLKRWARQKGMKFHIITEPRHMSSGRKFYLYSFREQWNQFWKIVLFSRRTLSDPKALGYFYDGRR